MKHVIFIGGIFSEELKDYIEKNSKGVIQYAADTLQKCYIEGLSKNDLSLQVFNLPYIGAFPQRFRKATFKFRDLYYSVGEQKIPVCNISFINLWGIKNIFRYRSLYKKLDQYLKKHRQGQTTIIIYAVHIPFIQACKKIKKKYPSVKIILIVPDLPEYMRLNEGFSHKLLKKIYSLIFPLSYDCIDAYVYLTGNMDKKIEISEKPFTVIEGMFSDKSEVPSEPNTKYIDSEKRYIVYTGTLARQYGILNLVHAFKQIKGEDLRLLIIGNGDSYEEIRHESKSDSRIILGGQLSHAEVLKIQSKAFLLVNPRTSEGEYTRFSFPSKTMEYLASGVPVLLNKLPGIPTEYYDYSFQPELETIDSLKKKIEEIISLTPKELQKKGERAREFILTKKNPQTQCKKLIDLIERIN